LGMITNTHVTSGPYANITGVGTITSGVWTGTAIAVVNGGTGATDAGTARTNLALGSSDSVVFGAVSANGTVSANRLSVSGLASTGVDYMATFTNADADNAASRNILMLKFSNMATPSSNHLFIDFHGHGGSLGAIRGTGALPSLSMQDHDGYPLMMAQAKSGIRFESTGADYAEYMPKQTPKESFKDGDIVGVVEGKITRNTAKAHKSMVISMMPVVVGNMPADKDKANYALVSFVGQVYVRVLGTVNAGDYIVASGKHDGTGMAVSRDAVTREMLPLVVGQAWETTTRKAEKLVKVGITPMDIPMPVDTATNSRLSKLEKENEILREQLNMLMKEVRSMKK
jgi:hypothetical protein